MPKLPRLPKKFRFRHGIVQGTGELVVDGQRLVGTFELRWNPAEHRPISFRFAVDDGPIEWLMRRAFNPEFGTVSVFTGQTDAGMAWTAVDVNVVGSHVSSSDPPTLDLTAGQVDIGPQHPTTRIDCFLPNMKLIGNEVSRVSRRRRVWHRRDRTRFELATPIGQARIALKSRIPNGGRVKEPRSTELSAVLSVRTERHAIDQLSAIARDLAWLIGFASGTSTTPLLVFVWSERSIEAVRFLDQYHTRSSHAEPLFPAVQPASLKSFLEQAYPRWTHLMQHATPIGRERKAAGPVMREVLSAYLESLTYPPFPMPVYLVAYAFEALLQSDLFEPASGEFAIGVVRDELYASFSEWAFRASKLMSMHAPELGTEFEKAIGNKFKDVMRRSLANSLRGIAKAIRCAISTTMDPSFRESTGSRDTWRFL
jgi:hypothetical protein